jgi:peptidoglycan hydrolase CwlO-like protein
MSAFILTADNVREVVDARNRVVKAEKELSEQRARVIDAQEALINHQANEARELADSLKAHIAQQEAAIAASFEQMLRDKAAHEAGVGVTRRELLLEELFERLSDLSEPALEAMLAMCKNQEGVIPYSD